MRFFTYILLFLFSLSIVGKRNLIRFIKKIKSPIELLSVIGFDDEAREIDDDKNKEDSEKKESEEKYSYYLKSDFHCRKLNCYNYNKHILNFYTLLFKSHFNEVVTPPPEFV